MRAQVRDVLAVDLAEAVLERLCAAHGCAGPLGNEPGVRPWLGDVESVPAYQVPGRPMSCPVRVYHSVLARGCGERARVPGAGPPHVLPCEGAPCVLARGCGERSRVPGAGPPHCLALSGYTTVCWLGDVESVPAYQVPGRPMSCPVRVYHARWLGDVESVPAYQVPGRPMSCPARVYHVCWLGDVESVPMYHVLGHLRACPTRVSHVFVSIGRAPTAALISKRLRAPLCEGIYGPGRDTLHTACQVKL